MTITNIRYDSTIVPFVVKDSEYAEPDIFYIYTRVGEKIPVIINSWGKDHNEIRNAFYKAIIDMEAKHGECKNIKSAYKMYLDELVRRDIKKLSSSLLSNMYKGIKQWMKNKGKSFMRKR